MTKTFQNTNKSNIPVSNYYKQLLALQMVTEVNSVTY